LIGGSSPQVVANTLERSKSDVTMCRAASGDNGRPGETMSVVGDYVAPMDARQAERLSRWLASLSREEREQAVAALRSQPRHDGDDAGDRRCHLVPQWVSVTDSGQPTEPDQSPR
jgi:hypothetical protein